MVKKAILLLSAAACLFGTAKAQVRCFTDEVNNKAKHEHPEIAVYEAQLKADINRRLQQMDLSKFKTTGILDDTATLHVPVVFHIVHDYGQEYITDNAVYEAVKEINQMYSRQNPDIVDLRPPYNGNIPGTNVQYAGNAKIVFHLPTKDPNGNPTHGITRRRSYLSASASDQAKYDIWPPTSYINIWIIRAFNSDHAFAAAYAYQPPTAAQIPYVDGVIGILQNNNINFDNTLAHELGHSLSLAHPWGNTNQPGVACGDDDVDDTPPTKGHNPTNCNDLAAIYDSACTFKDFVAVAKQFIDTNNGYTTDASTVDGINFTAVTQFTLNSLRFYASAPVGSPYTITLLKSGVPYRSYSSVTTGIFPNATTVSLGWFIDGGNYTLKFTQNPGAYRDSAFGTTAGVAGVVDITQDASNGYYNYFYGMNIKHGYFVIYPATVYEAYFGDTTVTTAQVVNYPDTVNSMNVMDYTYCSKMFSHLQTLRMRDALHSPVAGRNNLISDQNLTFTGALAPRQDLPPVADFSVANNAVFTCVNAPTATTFVNRSWNDTVTSLAWSLANATTSTSTANSVSSKFLTPGWATVSLTATSNAGSNTFTNDRAVYVADSAAISPVGYFQEFNPGSDTNRFPMFNYFGNDTKWEVVNNAGFYDNTSIRYKNFDTRFFPQTFIGSPGGDYDDFFTPAFDLRQLGGSTGFLTFFTSGAFRTNNPTYMKDTLNISYSTNCGQTWFTLANLGKNQIGNNGVQLTDFTPAGFWNWQPQNIALPSGLVSGGDKVFFRFRFRVGADQYQYGSGNNFYLDRIHIGKWTTDVNDLEAKSTGITLAPNPTTGSTSVHIKDTKANTANIQVTDVTGKLVYSTQATTSNGVTRVEIPANYITVKGVYLVQVVAGSSRHTEKLVVY
jgi:hypothetical protein